jgi:hypothetical protein
MGGILIGLDAAVKGSLYGYYFVIIEIDHELKKYIFQVFAIIVVLQINLLGVIKKPYQHFRQGSEAAFARRARRLCAVLAVPASGRRRRDLSWPLVS